MKNWQNLTTAENLQAIIEASHERPQLIFKHSTTCGISAQALYKLESASDELTDVADVHYLDLLSYRPISNQVAQTTGVLHQSPQVILVSEGKVVHNASHFSIEPRRVIAAVSDHQPS
ncbi:MAG: bacillithiol system redox-active protein YtxJ [Bacteroidota bacterium]